MSDIDTSLAPRRGRPPLNREAALPQPTVTSPSVEPPRRVTTRRPFSSIELKLAYEAREGYYRRWFNDTPGRIERAREAGYEHVKGRDDKNVSRHVGVAEGGGALTAYLMEIPLEWYQEDMAREQSLIDEKEAVIKRGENTQGAENDRRQMYVPSQGISIRR